MGVKRYFEMRCIIAVVAVLAMLATANPAGAAGEEVYWTEPVDAPIVDPFREPATRYSAGNRGIEYRTAGGEQVRAVDDGRVTFAGWVGGQRFVVVSHNDGLRSTYAYLDVISVVRGQQVVRSTLIGEASAGFHLTARLGDRYVDPALLFAGASVVLRLVESPISSALAKPGDLSVAGAGRVHSTSKSTSPNRWQTNQSRPVELTVAALRCTTGRLTTVGVQYDCSRHNEAAAGRRRPLRPPDSPLESEDEALYSR